MGLNFTTIDLKDKKIDDTIETEVLISNDAYALREGMKELASAIRELCTSINTKR